MHHKILNLSYGAYLNNMLVLFFMANSQNFFFFFMYMHCVANYLAKIEILFSLYNIFLEGKLINLSMITKLEISWSETLVSSRNADYCLKQKILLQHGSKILRSNWRKSGTKMKLKTIAKMRTFFQRLSDTSHS